MKPFIAIAALIAAIAAFSSTAHARGGPSAPSGSGPVIIGVDKEGRPIYSDNQGPVARLPDGTCVSRYAHNFNAEVPCQEPKQTKKTGG